MKISIRPRFTQPCVGYGYSKSSSCLNRQIKFNAIHETYSRKTFHSIFLANKSRITLHRKFSTFGLAQEYEDEENEDQGPLWQVIEKREEETQKSEKQNQNSGPPSSSPKEPFRKQNTVAVESEEMEEDTKKVEPLQLSQADISTTDLETATEHSQAATLQLQIKWNKQLNNFIKMSQNSKAMAMVDNALATNFPLSLVNWNSILKCYSRFNDFHNLQKTLKDMKQRGIQPNVISYNILIDTFGKRKKLQEMNRFFSRMLQEGVQPSVSTFTSMMHSYYQCDMHREALVLFNQMPEYGIPINQDSCMLAIRILAKNRDFEQLDAVMHLFEANHWNMDASGFFYAIEACAEAGDVERSIKFFERRKKLIRVPDLGLWTKMLQVLAQKGTMEQFKKYYLQARTEVERFDSIFYTAILGPLLKREEMNTFWMVTEHLQSDTQVGPGQTTWWSVALMDVYMRGCIKSQKFEEVPTILKRMQQFNLKPDLDMLSGMGSTGCQSLEGDQFSNFVKLYAKVAGAFVRYKQETQNVK